MATQLSTYADSKVWHLMWVYVSHGSSWLQDTVALDAAKMYTDAQMSSGLASAKSYTDTAKTALDGTVSTINSNVATMQSGAAGLGTVSLR